MPEQQTTESLSFEQQRQAAWQVYFGNHPEVLASWGHQNGRWPDCGCEPCQDSGLVHEPPEGNLFPTAEEDGV